MSAVKGIRAAQFCLFRNVKFLIIDKKVPSTLLKQLLNKAEVSSLLILWGEHDFSPEELSEIAKNLGSVENLCIKLRKKIENPEGLCAFLSSLNNTQTVLALTLLLPPVQLMWEKVMELLANDLFLKTPELKKFKLVCSRGNLKSNEFSLSLLQSFFNRINTCKKLQSLSLEHTLLDHTVRCSPDNSDPFIDFLKLGDKLKETLEKLSVGTYLPKSALQDLGYLLESCSSLKRLSLKLNLAGEQMLVLYKGIKACKRLEKVKLQVEEGLKVQTELFDSLCSLNIQKLYVENLWIHSGSLLNSLLNILKTNPVQELKLVECVHGFTKLSFELLIGELQNTQIKGMAIINCNFGPEFKVSKVVTILSSSLRFLCLSNSTMDQSSLFAAIEASTSLSSLIIHNEKGYASPTFYEPFTPPISLNYLDLSFPLFTDEHFMSKIISFTSDLRNYGYLQLSISLHCTDLLTAKYACGVLNNFSTFRTLRLAVSEDLFFDPETSVIDIFISRAPAFSIKKLVLTINRSEFAERIFNALPLIGGLQFFALEGCTIDPKQLWKFIGVIKNCPKMLNCKCGLKMPNPEFPSYICVNTCLIQLS